MSLSGDGFAGLRIPVVRAFAGGRALAILASQIVSVSVGWQLYEETSDPWALGLVGAIELIPVLFLTITAGNLADRFARRNLGMLAHAVLGLASLGLLAVSSSETPVEVIYVFLALIGAARTFASPSVNTLLPQLLHPDQYANVNAWLASSFELAATCGPAIGGILIALSGGTALSYAVAALCQFAFVAILSTLPAITPVHNRGRRTAREIFAGFRFIRRNPIFLAAITLDLFAVLLGGAVALLPIFAKDILHAGPLGLGILRAAPSLGALLMALLLTHLPPWKRPGLALMLTVAGFGVATLGFGLSRNIVLSVLCLFFTGVFDEISVVIRLTLEQVLTPDTLRGRVSAVHFVFIGFSNELGAFESGATAALFGPVASVIGGGIGTLLVVLTVVFAWPELLRLGPLQTLRPLDDSDAQNQPPEGQAGKGPPPGSTAEPVSSGLSR